MEIIRKRLSKLFIEEIKVFETNIKVFAKTKQGLYSCLHCLNSSIQPHGYHETRITDLPHDNKKVHVFVKRRRFKCLDCQKTFFEEVPHKFRAYMMTEFLAGFICSKYGQMTCNKLSGLLEVDRKTIMRLGEGFTQGHFGLKR